MVDLIRRQAYRYNLHSPDYFVLKHLHCFLKAQVDLLVQQGTQVVDVGCGEQPLRDWIEAKGGRYIGVDVQQNQRGTVEVVASAYEIPIASGTIDVVFCTEVLEHLQDVRQAISEMARLLRPGGFLVVTVPFAYPLHEEPTDFWRLTPYSLDSIASSSQMITVSLSVSGNEFEALATIWCNLLSRTLTKDNLSWKTLRKLLRIPVNICILLLSSLFRSRLPRKYYLSTLAVFRNAP